jgi:hypothetical protein
MPRNGLSSPQGTSYRAVHQKVDVERLFSGCRDEYGLRRHALKAGTVRVLTLLRS